MGQASVEAQYRAVRTGVGLFDLVGNGLLRVTGKNAIPFLHGLVSNEVRSLTVGTGVLAAFPNLQGKLVALARIYRIEGGVLLEVEGSNREKVVSNLSRFVLAGEFWIEDLSEAWGGLALEGPAVERLLGAVAEDWRIEEEQLPAAPCATLGDHPNWRGRGLGSGAPSVWRARLRPLPAAGGDRGDQGATAGRGGPLSGREDRSGGLRDGPDRGGGSTGGAGRR